MGGQTLLCCHFVQLGMRILKILSRQGSARCQLRHDHDHGGGDHDDDFHGLFHCAEQDDVTFLYWEHVSCDA